LVSSSRHAFLSNIPTLPALTTPCLRPADPPAEQAPATQRPRQQQRRRRKCTLFNSTHAPPASCRSACRASPCNTAAATTAEEAQEVYTVQLNPRPACVLQVRLPSEPLQHSGRDNRRGGARGAVGQPAAGERHLKGIAFVVFADAAAKVRGGACVCGWVWVLLALVEGETGAQAPEGRTAPPSHAFGLACLCHDETHLLNATRPSCRAGQGGGDAVGRAHPGPVHHHRPQPRQQGGTSRQPSGQARPAACGADGGRQQEQRQQQQQHLQQRQQGHSQQRRQGQQGQQGWQRRQRQQQQQ